MSSKSSRPGKKLSVPREMPAIQADYQRLCSNAGQLQYQLSVQSKELENINNQLVSVNREAAARMELDQEAKRKAAEAAAQPTQQSQAV